MEKRRHLATEILFCILKCIGYFAIWYGTQFVGVYAVLLFLAIRYKGSSYEAIARLTTAYSPQALIISNIVFVLVLALIYKIRKKPLSERCQITQKPIGVYLRVILLGIVGQFAIKYLLAYFYQLIPASWFTALEENNSSLTCAPANIVFISTVILAPIAEEILCRGLWLGAMRKIMPKWAAIILSSLIFGLLHANPIGIIYATLLGVLLGWVSTKFESILPTIIMHMAFNWTSLSLSESDGTGLVATLFLVSIPLMVYLIIRLAKYKEPEPTNNDDEDEV